MIPDLHPDAEAFSACRRLPGNRLRAYSVTTAARGWPGLEQCIRQCRATGKLVPASSDAYVMLDVLDAEDSIIQEYGVRDAAAWTWIKRKLHFTVASAD
ncbi:hypothetical protein CU254_40955 (plasmid) [Amycolatopsis sp. AA4]|uniref:hypothetical protein n=1 Tax=Actinomycetes TaxID=1760 RepID=UPI0001B5618B|nr:MULTISPECIES: hypothetical protein [Actinomycetes]ATY16964.1 hypothetical protein CU254_40955 [Amycolatopsis sp. AA4]EFL12548.1 predicted protein [Streptomyces sp. AA4]